MTITEPATLITDYILALAAASFAIILWRSEGPRRISRILWISGFMATALAAAVGGTYHGFALYFGDAFHSRLWYLTMVLIAAAALLIVAAALSGPLGRNVRSTSWLIAGGVLTAVGFGVQQSGLSLHAHFNHNDLYHCIQTVALYLFFRGAQPGLSPTRPFLSRS